MPCLRVWAGGSDCQAWRVRGGTTRSPSTAGEAAQDRGGCLLRAAERCPRGLSGVGAGWGFGELGLAALAEVWDCSARASALLRGSETSRTLRPMALPVRVKAPTRCHWLQTMAQPRTKQLRWRTKQRNEKGGKYWANC